MPDLFLTLPPSLLDAAGLAGFGLYVLNYALLTLQRGRADRIGHFAINGTAASLVLIGLAQDFNLASALIQIFWIVMSAVAIVLRLRRARTPVFSTIRTRGFTPTEPAPVFLPSRNIPGEAPLRGRGQRPPATRATLAPAA